MSVLPGARSRGANRVVERRVVRVGRGGSSKQDQLLSREGQNVSTLSFLRTGSWHALCVVGVRGWWLVCGRCEWLVVGVCVVGAWGWCMFCRDTIVRAMVAHKGVSLLRHLGCCLAQCSVHQIRRDLAYPGRT